MMLKRHAGRIHAGMASRRAGIRGQILLVVLLVLLVPLVAGAVAWTRVITLERDGAATQSALAARDARNAADVRVLRGVASLAANASRVTRDSVKASPEAEWLVPPNGSSILARSSTAPASDDGSVELLARSNRATGLPASAGPGSNGTAPTGTLPGILEAANTPSGVLVVLVPSSILLEGAAPGTALLAVPAPGSAPMDSAPAYVLVPAAAPNLVLWDAAAIVLLVFLVASAWMVAVLLTDRIVRPLQGITEAARRFEAGDRSARAPIVGSAEAAELAETLNGLADEVASEEARMTVDLADLGAVAAHEYRESLRSLGTLARNVLRDPEVRMNEDARFVLESVAARSEELERVAADLDRILGVSRRSLREETIDLGAAASAVASEFREHGQDVLVEGTAEAVGDPDAIREIVRELVENGLKFNRHEHAFVRVEVEAGAEEARIVVEDNGPGIPAKRTSDVLRPFRRLQARRDVPGTGAGLAIVARLLDRLHGSVEFGRSRFGGTRVIAHFPAPSPAQTRRSTNGVGAGGEGS